MPSLHHSAMSPPCSRRAQVLGLLLALSSAPVAAEIDPYRATTLLAPPGSNPGAFGVAVELLDFDGDGDLEIAVSDPSEALTDEDGRGVVHVFHRTPTGWQELNTFELLNDRVGFGLRLASGDFDGDGRDDLLIGAPHTNSGGGAVYLVRHLDPLTIIQDGLIVNGGASGGGCGSSLAVGDFNDDGNLDFATGCPNASFDSFTNVGRVQRAYGFGNGSFNMGFLSQATANVGGGPETGDRFGIALAAGDFDCDAVDDLAIGASNESVDGGIETGVVHVLYGSQADGLTGTGSQLLRQGVDGLPGTPGDGDGFGTSFAAADFDDGFLIRCDDLAIGIPDDLENPGGAVMVLPSAGSSGIGSSGAELLTIADFPQDPFLHPGARGPDQNSRLGAVLATARLGRSAHPDLLIGVEGWTSFAIGERSGLVCVAYADGTSVLAQGQRCYGQAQVAPGEAEDSDFGMAMAVGELDVEAGPELVIGSSGRNRVYVLPDGLFRDGFEGSSD